MKTILITGCSAGIGYGLVQKFLTYNYRVIAVSRNIDSLKLINNNLLEIIQADITNDTDQMRIIALLNKINKNSNIEIINNAAFGQPEIFINMSIETIKHHFETNFFAPIILLQKILAQISVTKVLNISSGAAENPLLSLFAYCTSKSAMHHAIKCLNLEYHDTKFANLRPGMVDTPLQDRWRNVDSRVFPNGNFYLKAKEEKRLINVTTVADYVFWVMNQPIDIFTQDWNIANENDQKYWLKNHPIYVL
jgi:benzil reductase ((S)-benzoin forming)